MGLAKKRSNYKSPQIDLVRLVVGWPFMYYKLKNSILTMAAASKTIVEFQGL